MGLATITLRDKDGAIDVGLVFEGGFNPASHAHQHAQLLIKHMDELAVRQGEPVVKAMDKLHAMAAEANAPLASQLVIARG